MSKFMKCAMFIDLYILLRYITSYHVLYIDTVNYTVMNLLKQV